MLFGPGAEVLFTVYGNPVAFHDQIMCLVHLSPFQPFQKKGLNLVTQGPCYYLQVGDQMPE
jgi:hypothetical protein